MNDDKHYKGIYLRALIYIAITGVIALVFCGMYEATGNSTYSAIVFGICLSLFVLYIMMECDALIRKLKEKKLARSEHDEADNNESSTNIS